MKLYRSTRGQNKFEQYSADLERNTIFKEKLERIKVLIQASGYPKTHETREVKRVKSEIKSLIKQVKQKEQELENLQKGTPYYQAKELAFDIAYEYGIGDILDDITRALHFGKPIKMGNHRDICRANNLYMQLLFPLPKPLGTRVPEIIENHLIAYPVSIDINRMASKEDVLDFVEKRWHVIAEELALFRKTNKKRIKKRLKVDRKISDFIWEHRNMPTKKIKELLNSNFPGNGIAYYEVGKIKSLEKERREKRIDMRVEGIF